MERKTGVRGKKGFWGKRAAVFFVGEDTLTDSRVFSFFIFSVTLLSGFACAGTITLGTDIELPAPTPDPNQDITVWVQTNAPLLCMEVRVQVEGDAVITDLMDETDGGQHGWDTNYTPLAWVNPDNSVVFSTIQWSTNYHSTVGYFKFRRLSGVVTIKIDLGYSTALNWTHEIFYFDPTPIVVGSLPVVEITSDITTNQVWTANNAYYITTEAVNVQALLVIEPGTRIVMGYDSALFVNNGGTLIAKGLPDNPIVFTPDTVHFNYPGEVGYYWKFYENYGPQYLTAVYLQPSASPASVVQNCLIEGAGAGVVVENIRLTNAIENNWFFANYRGIYTGGPRLTDIRNNLFFYNDLASIEAFLLVDPNDTTGKDMPFNIEQNTCDMYQYIGIWIHGVSDPNQSPAVYIRNNILSSCYDYGLAIGGDYITMSVANNGYYDNGSNKNWDFEEFNPVTTTEFPFLPYPHPLYSEGGPQCHHYLAQTSPFVNAGTDYIERTPLVGTTTSMTHIPDKDWIDLGFHFFDWGYSGSEEVVGADMDDLITLANYWLAWSPYDPNSPAYIDPNSPGYDPNTISFGGDWNNDGHVDMVDVNSLSEVWLTEFKLPNLVPVIEGDPNEGHIALSATGYSPDTQTIYAYLNGKYLGRIFDCGDDLPIGIDLSANGPNPMIKFIAVNNQGNYYFSPLMEIAYTSPLSYCIVPQTYEPNEPIPFSAINTGTGNTTVFMYADGGQLAWSQEFTGNTISGSIPASVIQAYLTIDSIVFAAAGEMPVSKTISPEDIFDPDAEALIIVADPILGDPHRGPPARHEALLAFRNRGINWKKLEGSQATWERVAEYGWFGNIKYIFFLGHGNYFLGANEPDKLRTLTYFYQNDPVVSCKASKFVTPPGWCKPFPEAAEQKVKTWYSMGFDQLIFSS